MFLNIVSCFVGIGYAYCFEAPLRAHLQAMYQDGILVQSILILYWSYAKCTVHTNFFESTIAEHLLIEILLVQAIPTVVGVVRRVQLSSSVMGFIHNVLWTSSSTMSISAARVYVHQVVPNPRLQLEGEPKKTRNIVK